MAAMYFMCSSCQSFSDTLNNQSCSGWHLGGCFGAPYCHSEGLSFILNIAVACCQWLYGLKGKLEVFTSPSHIILQ